MPEKNNLLLLINPETFFSCAQSKPLKRKSTMETAIIIAVTFLITFLLALAKSKN